MHLKETNTFIKVKGGVMNNYAKKTGISHVHFG